MRKDESLVCIYRYSRDLFTRDADGENKNRWSTWASDLGPLRNGPRWGRVWNDACDEGFIMLSPETGREVIFTLAETHHDQDSDVTDWIFKPYTHRMPADVKVHVERMNVIVWND